MLFQKILKSRNINGGVAGVAPAEGIARNNVRAQGETSPSFGKLSTQTQFAIVTILVAKLFNLAWNARNFNFNHALDDNLFDCNVKQVSKHEQVVDCRNRFSAFPRIHCLRILQVRQGTLRLKPWQTCLPPSGVIKTKNCTVSDLMPLRASANVNNFQLCKRRLSVVFVRQLPLNQQPAFE